MPAVYELLNTWFCCEYTARECGWGMRDMHYHLSHELFVMMSGRTSIMSENKIIPVEKGDVVLFKKHKLHKNNGGTEHGRYAVNFSDKYLNTYFTEKASIALMRCFDHEKISIPPQKLGYVSAILKKMESGNDEFAYLAVLLSILDVFAHNDESARTDGNQEDVNSILEFINKNYSTINGIEEIAEAVHTSKSYLCQKFKRETNMTVTEYLNSVRIKNACAMLEEGRYNVTETALNCGYSTSSYFCKMFKSIVNMTPHEYKRYTENVRDI